MRVPYGWLREFVEVPWDPQELADRLCLVGVKVEAVHRLDYPLERVVAGRVTAVAVHPAATGLRVVTLEVGAGSPRQVVSGAPGMAPGDLVAVALPGAMLPGGRKVEETAFRGVTSEGMICSATELAIGAHPVQGEGIVKLPTGSEPGRPIAELAQIGEATEWVLELELTVNYAMHCQSVEGVAREVAALLGIPWQPRRPQVIEQGESVETWAQVEITDAELCPRYVLRVFHDLVPGASPVWMQRRLHAAGLRPIGVVVDVTNYVMLEQGQPLHAFDYHRLADRRIVVRRARDGEELVTLDGVSRRLDSSMLVIADARVPVGLAGIMGGLDSEVTAATRVVALESAHFDPATLQRTSLRLGLRTEASQRFSRWVDPEGTARAADRAAELLVAVGAGRVAPGSIDVCPAPFRRRPVHLRPGRVASMLGVDLQPHEIADYLGRLGFQTAGTQDGYLVTVPSWRADVSTEADLAEEVARLHGYNAIRATLPRGVLSYGVRPARQQAVDRVVEILVGCGLSEIMTSAMFGPRAFDRLRLEPGDPCRRALRLANPLMEEQSLLRTTLLPGLLEVMSHNASHRQLDVGLFEAAVVFLPGRDPEDLDGYRLATTGGDLSPWVREELRLSLGMMGNRAPAHWRGGGRVADFFELKGVVEIAGERLGWPSWRFDPSDHPTFHPARQAWLLVEGEKVGVLGELHPDVQEAFGLERACAAELELARLLGRSRAEVAYRPLPRYPAVLRDISLLVEATVSADRVAEVIRRSAGALLDRVTLFDVYRGPGIPEGTRSLAYSLVYRACDRTLTDAEVDAVHLGVREALVRELGARLR